MLGANASVLTDLRSTNWLAESYTLTSICEIRRVLSTRISNNHVEVQKLIAVAHLDDWALWHRLNGYERRCWHCGGRGPIAQYEEQGSQPHNPVNHRLLLKKYSAIVGLESGARKLPGNDVPGNDVMHWLADRKVENSSPIRHQN